MSSSKPTNQSTDENRRKSTRIVKSDDCRKTKYNYLRLNKTANRSRSDAITELEIMYDKLNEQLLDNELLDRAERRDLPFSHQLIWANDHNNNHISNPVEDNQTTGHNLVSDQTDGYYNEFNKRRSMATIAALKALRNDFNCGQHLPRDQWMTRSRTPPYRRSAIPDIVRDDFAIRKYNKSLSHSHLNSNPEICGFNSIKRINANKHYSMSYLLTTSSADDIYYDDTDDPIYTNDEDLKHVSKANIKADDLSYRRIRQSAANNVLPPHPPFGIPNSIISSVGHCSVNDYLRAELDPKDSARVGFRCKSSIPHLIRDDMAFRTLRKDFRGSAIAVPSVGSLTSRPMNKSMPDISVAHRMTSRV